MAQDEIIRLRLPADVKDDLQRAADTVGLSVSELIRQSLETPVRQILTGAMKLEDGRLKIQIKPGSLFSAIERIEKSVDKLRADYDALVKENARLSKLVKEAT